MNNARLVAQPDPQLFHKRDPELFTPKDQERDALRNLGQDFGKDLYAAVVSEHQHYCDADGRSRCSINFVAADEAKLLEEQGANVIRYKQADSLQGLINDKLCLNEERVVAVLDAARKNDPQAKPPSPQQVMVKEGYSMTYLQETRERAQARNLVPA